MHVNSLDFTLPPHGWGPRISQHRRGREQGKSGAAVQWEVYPQTDCCQVQLLMSKLLLTGTLKYRITTRGGGIYREHYGRLALYRDCTHLPTSSNQCSPRVFRGT